MKRTICAMLLALSLLAGLMLPVFATEEAEQETQLLAQSEPTAEIVTEPPSEAEMVTEPQAEAMQVTRAPTTYTTSAEGVAFINEMMGSTIGNSQLAAAEGYVNSFITRTGAALTQQQFDALVDFCAAYNSNMLGNGYRVETMISSGEYTDAELAGAFCAWVKGTDGTLSQQRLARRLREIKLFLYGSYDGVCSAYFRYVVFYPNGGTLSDNTVLCYPLNETYSALPTASHSSRYFAGWYTASSGGTHLCNTDAVTGNQTVYAHWSETPVSNPNEAGTTDPNPSLDPPDLRMSEAGVQFIKDHEGFIKYAMWDYSQWSIGYGSRCEENEFPDGITEEEADYRLRLMLVDFEKSVNSFESRTGRTFSQQEYDALVSFTYNLGAGWMSNSSNTITQLLLSGNFTEMEFVNALGRWIHAGGTALSGLATRRMDEANLFLNGDYTLNCRVYLRLVFNASEGECATNFYYYKTGNAIGWMPAPTRDGHNFTGWYDKIEGGTQYTASTAAPNYRNLTLYAHWEIGGETVNPPEPTDPEPTDPTNPEPTEPTNPEPTDPTDPEPTEPNIGGFVDVPTGQWYSEFVRRAVEEALFSGISDTEFDPHGTMTRAMLVTVLWRYAGEPSAEASHPFTDVTEGRYYSAAIAWAYQNGIVNGMEETVFGVDAPITREQLTTILHRYAIQQELDTTQKAELDAFADAAQISNFALEAMQWAVAVEILNGDGTGLSPAGNATRAQCAKMMVVFLETYS